MRLTKQQKDALFFGLIERVCDRLEDIGAENGDRLYESVEEQLQGVYHELDLLEVDGV